MDDTPLVEGLIRDLLNNQGQAEQQAAGRLMELGGTAIQPLLDAIKDDDRNESVVEFEHRILRQVLIQLGEPAFTAVLGALRSSDEMGRAAVKILVLFHDARAIEPLIELVRGDGGDSSARIYAIDALAYFKDVRAFESLLAALQHEDALIRGHAAIALGEYRRAQALEALHAALDKPGTTQWMDWRGSVAEAIRAIIDSSFTPVNRGFFINNRYF